MLAGNPPRRSARDSITQQPHLQLGHPFVSLQGGFVGSPAFTNVAQQQLQGFRANRVRRDQLMARVDTQIAVDDGPGRGMAG